jgi:hypothetical protein
MPKTHGNLAVLQAAHTFKILQDSSYPKKKRGYRVCSSGYAATDTS